MKARIKPNNNTNVNISTVLDKLLTDEELARELWDNNFANRADKKTGSTFEEWYANIQKASFLTKIHEISNTKQGGNRHERRRAKREE